MSGPTAGRPTKGSTANAREPGNWWILGSTNYAVVDPAKPRKPRELSRTYVSPQTSDAPALGVGGILGLFSSAFGSASRVFDTPGEWSQTRRRSSRRGRTEQGGYFASLRSPIGGERAIGTTSRKASYLAFPEELNSSMQSTSGSMNSLSFQRPFYAPSRSSFQSFRSRVGVKSQGKVPSFRAIIQQLQADARRRRSSGSSLTIPGSRRASQFEGVERLICRDRRIGFGSNTPFSGAVKSFKNEDTPEALLRELARERLKRSFTRLPTRMVSPVLSRQRERSSVDLFGSSFSDIAKQTTRVLGRLERASRWSELQLRNLQRAAGIIEAMAVLVEPELGQRNNGGQREGASVFDRQTCYSNWGVLGMARSSEPHAAMTVSRLHEGMESATVRELRQQQLKFLGTLLKHVQAARECEEVMVEAVANDLSSALSTIDVLMEKGGNNDLPSQLVLPVALVSLVCAVAHSYCTAGSCEITAQTLERLLIRYGPEGANAADQAAMRSLRYSVLYESLLDHLHQVEELAVKMLSLVLTYADILSCQHHAASSLQAHREQPGSFAGVQQEASIPASKSPDAFPHSEVQSMLAAAQRTNSAICEAGGRRDEPILLEGEALRRRDPTMIHSPKVVLQKLSFASVELRLFLSKLLALRLTLSELGCMRIAWDEIKAFEAHASSYLERLNSEE